MTKESNKPVSELEIANIRHNLGLLRSQLKGGRLNEDFLSQQIDKVDNLLQRVGVEHKTRSHGARFEALYNVSRVLGSSLDLQVVLDQVMDAIIHLTGAERGFLMLRDDDGGVTVKAARNLDQQTLTSEQFKFSRTVVNQVLDTESPILTTNAAEDPRFANKASIVAQSLRSVMATPLRARGNVIGVVYVDSRALVGLFKQEDLDALDAFSTQAAIALDNALLFAATDEELSHRIEQLRQLRRIDLLLNETLDAEKAMQYTLEWACRLSGATSGYLGLQEGKSLVTANHYGLTEQDSIPKNLEQTYPSTKEVMEAGNSRLVKRDDGDNALIVPVRREQEVIGVVILLGEDSEFSEDQQDIVERVVARAAVTIENAQLYAAVQEADKAKSEFVGIVAHDLKAPMTGIKGYSELMLMQGDTLNDRQKDFLKKIAATVERMEILVSDLADISRIESGHFFMEETRTTVEEVVQAVRDSTLPQFKERDHKWAEDISEGLPDLWVDYYRLLQVLTNLVSNAYKYTPPGGTITLTVRKTGNRVQFSVKDTGIGLSEKGIAMLGTKFWRAEDDFTRSQHGTGLGFSITSRLIEQMGDYVSIESELGKGSTFTFSVATAESDK